MVTFPKENVNPQIEKSTKRPNHDVVAGLDSAIEKDAEDIAIRSEDLPLRQFLMKMMSFSFK